MGESRMPLVAEVHAVRRGRLAAAAAVVGRLVLLSAVLGVVAMHQLAGLPAGHSHDHDAVPRVHAVLAAADHCPHPAGAQCPGRLHGHPGQVCQPHQSGNGPDGIPALAPLPQEPPQPALLTARTAAREAGNGTGCGPPRLSELSLRRI